MKGRIVVSLLVLVVAVYAAPALAEDAVSVDIPIGNLFGDPGDLVLVATVPTEPGLTCVGSVDPVNNESNHDNTDVVYVSGAAGGTIFDVEMPTFDPDQIVAFVAEGPTLIFFRIGDDGVISAGFIAMLDCHEQEETTTTTVVSSTTSTTHVDTTTTTEPPPVGGVPTGGGACADGGCLSPLATWMWIGGIGAGVLLLAVVLPLLVTKGDDDAPQGI